MESLHLISSPVASPDELSWLRSLHILGFLFRCVTMVRTAWVGCCCNQSHLQSQPAASLFLMNVCLGIVCGRFRAAR